MIAEPATLTSNLEIPAPLISNLTTPPLRRLGHILGNSITNIQTGVGQFCDRAGLELAKFQIEHKFKSTLLTYVGAVAGTLAFQTLPSPLEISQGFTIIVNNFQPQPVHAAGLPGLGEPSLMDGLPPTPTLPSGNPHGFCCDKQYPTVIQIPKGGNMLTVAEKALRGCFRDDQNMINQFLEWVRRINLPDLREQQWVAMPQPVPPLCVNPSQIAPTFTPTPSGTLAPMDRLPVLPIGTPGPVSNGTPDTFLENLGNLFPLGAFAGIVSYLIFWVRNTFGKKPN